MRCEHCGRNEATFHYQRTVNGRTSEAHLCPRCAAELGCAAAGAPEELTDALCVYATHLGLAFQLRDDLLDAGEDKPTFVSVLGADGCAAEVARLTDAAVAALRGVDDAGFLIWLARTLAAREK